MIYHGRYTKWSNRYVLHADGCRFAPRWGIVEAENAGEAIAILIARWPAATRDRWHTCDVCLYHDLSFVESVRSDSQNAA